MYIMLDGMYETMSISTGLYPNLDLWNAHRLHYVTLNNTMKSDLLARFLDNGWYIKVCVYFPCKVLTLRLRHLKYLCKKQTVLVQNL